MSVDYENIFWPLLHNKIRRGVKNHTFGMVRKYSTGVAKPHQGWDFEATIGTPFYAIGSGKVEFVRSMGDYGLQLCHSFEFNGEKLYAFYAHLERTYVEAVKKLIFSAVGFLISLATEFSTALFSSAIKRRWILKLSELFA